MNERIKELAEQAGAVTVWSWASDDVLDTTNMDAKKFAELIVKECAERLMQDDFKDFRSVVYIAGLRLKEHFGVEE
jgi:hypothetical protein